MADDIELRVLIPAQRVELAAADRLLWSGPCSTSAFGTGFEEGSLRTPTGLHRVGEKIGDGAPWGTVFKGRVPTGEIWSPGCGLDGDLILSRILRLEGLEPSNANTRDRYVYFHGTNEEEKIGTPAGHGCIRLRNDDIIALYELVPVGTPVHILEQGENPEPI